MFWFLCTNQIDSYNVFVWYVIAKKLSMLAAWFYIMADDWYQSYFFCVFLQLNEEIAAAGIQTYSLPECDEDEDVEYKQQCSLLKVLFTVENQAKHSGLAVLDTHILVCICLQRMGRVGDLSLCFWDLRLALKDLSCDSSTKTWDLLETRP